jgi:hypothetical protein
MYLTQIYQLNISYNNFRKPRKLINFNLFHSIKITNYTIFNFYVLHLIIIMLWML